MEEPILNNHNKQEFPPMHSAEHLLNGEMARRYGHGRAFSTHIERKKSKLDYHLPKALTDEEIKSLEDYVKYLGAVLRTQRGLRGKNREERQKRRHECRSDGFK